MVNFVDIWFDKSLIHFVSVKKQKHSSASLLSLGKKQAEKAKLQSSVKSYIVSNSWLNQLQIKLIENKII